MYHNQIKQRQEQRKLLDNLDNLFQYEREWDNVMVKKRSLWNKLDISKPTHEIILFYTFNQFHKQANLELPY